MDKPKMKIASGPMPTRSELQRLARLGHRVKEVESENTVLRQRHGEDVAHIRQLEDQVRRLKDEVARLESRSG
jgi:predicted nuclease with TOPRIM domain